MFRRRTPKDPAAESADHASEPSSATLTEARDGSASGGRTTTATAPKGRPTPKRSEAEKARKERVRPPKDRREAMRLQRERARADRVKVQQAMATGDDRYLPARDKGKQRRFVRDFIDVRRTPAEYLLPFFLVIFVLMMIPVGGVVQIATFLWLAAIIVTPIDLFMVSRKLKRELQARFPKESHKGSTTYALMRATQIRRLRLPKPQIKPGQPLPEHY